MENTPARVGGETAAAGESGDSRAAGRSGVGSAGATGGIGVGGVVRQREQAARALGRGPIPYDKRKFRYDRVEGKRTERVGFFASKADRMDAEEAGAILQRIHELVGIDREPESVLLAFDKALFFEHSINGASIMQPGRGVLKVGGEGVFDLGPIRKLLGPDARRFYRAFADEIADVNREVLASYDPWKPETAEMYSQLSRLAVERNLVKYPYLVHDSADACVNLSVEERVAVMASKKSVIESSRNAVDVLHDRVNENEMD